MKRICQFISDHMGVLVLLAAVAALMFPEALGHLKPRLINPLLGAIMFGMGLTLKAADFRVVFSRPRDVLVGCLAQFTVMPLLAFALTRIFKLEPALAIGVILVGCCPGGTASNVITYLSKGDLALSVGMTATSTLLAPILTPLLVWLLAGETVDVDVVGMLLSILWVVILPIALGLVVKRFWPRTTERASAYLPALSTLAICVIVLIVIAANAHKLLDGGLVILLVVVLRPRRRLSDRHPPAPGAGQAPRHQHRSGHAEQRPRLLAGHPALRRLSPRHHPRRPVQRLAQRQRRHRRLVVREIRQFVSFS